jgi:hypothetical protein
MQDDAHLQNAPQLLLRSCCKVSGVLISDEQSGRAVSFVHMSKHAMLAHATIMWQTPFLTGPGTLLLTTQSKSIPLPQQMQAIAYQDLNSYK